MSRSSVLARGRVAAGAGMVDTCVIRRQTDSSTDADGVVTPTWATVYSGVCRVQESSQGADGSTSTPGPETVLLVGRQLQLPVATSLDVRADDRATITACVHDPDLVDRVLVITGEAAATEKTARRLSVREVTA